MKKRFQLTFRLVFLCLVFAMPAIVALGQPGDPQGGVKPNAPISGIEILLGAGMLFGLRKLIGKKPGND